MCLSIYYTIHKHKSQPGARNLSSCGRIIAMKALYRRYRPKTLSEVVGQEQITSVLEKAIKNGKLAHAYLFIGPRGTGKTSVARILAHEINGFPYELEDDYLDIIEIDAASNTGVDNIRELREKAIVAPSKGKYKVYIIDEVHMLSKSAFNALLKTLEEPPEHVVFIMATTDAYKVPVTITSRSQVFTFKLANPSTMLDHLKKIAKAEKINITDEALEIVVRRGGGSFRDSLSLLDQVSTLSDGQIDATLLNNALGLPAQDALTNILQGYASGDADRVRKTLADLLDTGIKPEVVADNLITTILDDPQPIWLGLMDKLTEVSRNAYPNVKLLLALTAPATPVAPAPRATITTTVKPVAVTPKPAPAPASTPKAEPKTTTPAPEPTPEPTPAPAPAPARVASDADAAEIWNQVILHAEEAAPGIVRFLNESDYTIADHKLTIYAKKKFPKTQIDKRRGIIAEVLPADYTVEVNDQVLNQDADLAAIAELMGGGEEVHIDE